MIAEVAGSADRHSGVPPCDSDQQPRLRKPLVTADLADDAVDRALGRVRRLGLPSEDVVLVRLDSIGPAVGQRPRARVVWAELLSQAGANARPLARYLVFMAAAGLIAAFGVIYANTTLVVGGWRSARTHCQSAPQRPLWSWVGGDWSALRLPGQFTPNG